MKMFPLAPLLHLQLLFIPGFLQSSHTGPLDVPGRCHMHSHFGPLHLLLCPLAVRFHPYKCTASSLPSLKSLFKSYLIQNFNPVADISYSSFLFFSSKRLLLSNRPYIVPIYLAYCPSHLLKYKPLKGRDFNQIYLVSYYILSI